MNDGGLTLNKVVGWTLPVLIGWALLAALWNIAGVILISQGHQPLGPTASAVGAVLLVVVALALYWSASKAPIVFVLLSALAGIGAALTVAGAITGDPSLWPTAFWRIAGAVLNAIGTVGAVGAIVAYFKWRGWTSF